MVNEREDTLELASNSRFFVMVYAFRSRVVRNSIRITFQHSYSVSMASLP